MGVFITIEGGDGSGKSTQVALLRESLARRGVDALFLREPGGTDVGERLRQVILDKNNRGMSPWTEALLYAAAREQLVAEVVTPALAAGKTLICDRYVDSSVAYQGFGRNLGARYVLDLNVHAMAAAMPVRTIYLDLPPERGILRKKGQHDLDRLEEEALAFHQRVYDGYTWICRRDPERVRRVNADAARETVHRDVLAALEDLL